VLEHGFCAEIIIGKCISGCSPEIACLLFKHLYTPLLLTGYHHPNQSETLKKEKTAQPLMPPHTCVAS
jgi:hypothetical protein